MSCYEAKMDQNTASIFPMTFPDSEIRPVHGTAATEVSSSAGDTVPSSEIGANCISCDCLEVRRLYPGSKVFVVLMSNNQASVLPAAFLKESISRPIIVGRYLGIEFSFLSVSEGRVSNVVSTYTWLPLNNIAQE